MVRLNRTYYSLLKLQAKFSKLSSPIKFQRITQIPRNSPTQSANYAKFAHFVNLFYIMFQAPARQRTLQNSSELRRFRAIRPHSRESRKFRTLRTIIKTYVIDFQISDHRQRTQENWSESTRFRSICPPIMRITRIPHISQ